MATDRIRKRKAKDADMSTTTQPGISKHGNKKIKTVHKDVEVQGGSSVLDKKGRKRKRKAKIPEALAPDEEIRRQKQRELQKLALRLQGEGKPYKRPPEKKRKLQAGLDSKPRLAGKMTERGGLDQEETGSRPSQVVQVIVIPIFWNRKPEEKEQVIAAGGYIVNLLETAGIETGIDTTTTLSPGQKFGYWEEKGVKVRVECGPSDINRHTCVLAVNKKAGELAEKQTLKVGPKMVSQIRTQLGMPTPQGTTKTNEEKHTTEDAPIVGQKRTAPVRAVFTSGDDLGGDFEGLEVGDEDAEKGVKKKRRLKHA